MIDPLFLTGILGSIILIIGAAWPVAMTGHPAMSRKNQLFAVGNVCMFAYAILRYFDGGSFFFILLQILVALSTVLMLLDTKDRNDTAVIAAGGCALIVYSLYLFQGIQTIIFVAGLSTLGMGFAMNMATVRRQVALMTGSVLIAWFSAVVGDTVFLWLNIIFALLCVWQIQRLEKL